ncbi:hypothetical protein J3D47_004122 [Pseudomonas laurylsulfativorans]|nr:hypothetical protein [Pseudomonas laurylsulfativorans]
MRNHPLMLTVIFFIYTYSLAWWLSEAFLDLL